MRNLTLALLVAAGGAAAEPVTVAALGDSLTQGYGLPVDQGLVPQLESWLVARGLDVTVINAGVSGDTSTGGLARVGWTLGAGVDAMIVELGANDMLRGLDPAMTRANLAGILDVARMQGVDVLLIGVPAVDNYGADYKAAFDTMFSDLAQSYGVALYPDIFAALREGDTETARRDFMQADGIHPDAEGVARIVDDLGPAVAALVEEAGGGAEVAAPPAAAAVRRDGADTGDGGDVEE